VLHAFEKESPSGINTARKDVELIARRLNDAKADYDVRYSKEISRGLFQARAMSSPILISPTQKKYRRRFDSRSLSINRFP
jgi:hypothetical protein